MYGPLSPVKLSQGLAGKKVVNLSVTQIKMLLINGVLEMKAKGIVLHVRKNRG